MNKFVFIIAFLVLVGQAPAAWTRIELGPFTFLTHGDPARAKALMTEFEQLEDALSATSEFHPDREATLKIISFGSEAEFVPYRLNSASCAFYQQTARGEYIVLQPVDGPNRSVSFHEFTHFVFAHSNVRLPLWLNEGLADFYSTFRVDGDRVTFGRPVAGRLDLLKDSGLLPLTTLFEVNTASSYYSSPERMAIFYSESWALAHMLVASADYGGHFPNFLKSVNAGHSTADSLQAAYGKSATQVQQDLGEYVRSRRLPVVERQFRGSTTALPSVEAAVSDAEVDIQLSALALTNANTQAELQDRLAAASQELKENPAAEESLGYAALRQGKVDEARRHFRTAVERNSRDANVLFYLAHLDREAGEPVDEVMPLLEKAVTLKPDSGDPRLELALLATEGGDYERALKALHGMPSPRPENAYTAAYTEAFCLANTNQLQEAGTALERARRLALTEHDRAEVAALFGFIEEQTKELAASRVK